MLTAACRQGNAKAQGAAGKVQTGSEEVQGEEEGMWLYCTTACQPGAHGVATVLICLQAETEELKKQIEDLSSRLSVLSAENSSLQNRNSLLEKVVQIRGNGDASVSAEVTAVTSTLHAISHQRIA